MLGPSLRVVVNDQLRFRSFEEVPVVLVYVDAYDARGRQVDHHASCLAVAAEMACPRKRPGDDAGGQAKSRVVRDGQRFLVR